MNDSRRRQKWRVEVQWAGNGKSIMTTPNLGEIAQFFDRLDEDMADELGLESVTIAKIPDKEDDSDLCISPTALKHVGPVVHRQYWRT